MYALFSTTDLVLRTHEQAANEIWGDMGMKI